MSSNPILYELEIYFLNRLLKQFPLSGNWVKIKFKTSSLS
jgi:hypothetical protein